MTPTSYSKKRFLPLHLDCDIQYDINEALLEDGMLPFTMELIRPGGKTLDSSVIRTTVYFHLSELTRFYRPKTSCRKYVAKHDLEVNGFPGFVAMVETEETISQAKKHRGRS
jgi:hypothetical protein